MKIKNTILACFLFLLASCGQQAPENKIESSQSEQSKTVEVEGALVRVDGEIITQDDLDAAIDRTVGELAAFQLDDKGRQKVLESIVLSTIMANKQMAQLSEDEKQSIERQVKVYRNEVLTKRYLRENIVPIPVTNKMVQAYYDSNPEKFGGKTIRVYQVIKGLTKLEGQVRDRLLKELDRIASTSDWKQQVAQAKKQGTQIEFSTGASDGQSLNKKIGQIIQSLEPNQVSSLHYVEGLPMVFKLIELRKVQPKPLSQVRSEIRKSLAPMQLKAAVRKISKDLLAKAQIEYATSENTNK